MTPLLETNIQRWAAPAAARAVGRRKTRGRVYFCLFFVQSLALRAPCPSVQTGLRGLRIGPHLLPNNLFVAPMAGVTDRPFRQLCRRLGAGYAVSEMVTSRKGPVAQPEDLAPRQP